MAPDKTYYAWGNKTPKVFRKTPKQLRLIDGEGSVTVVKPHAGFNHLNGVLHTYTFADGTTRQWFHTGFKGYGHTHHHGLNADEFAQEMKKDLVRGGCWLQHYGFVAHPDDKVFHRNRIAYTHQWTRDYDGGVNRSVTYSGQFKIVRAWRGLPDEYAPVHRTVVVCETWVKWGGLEILLDDGLKRWTTYDIGDNAVDHVAPRKFLRLDDFRASPAPNPFDDPFDPALKAMRDKRNEMNEDIARAVFHPERVGRMMTAYGEDWDERV